MAARQQKNAIQKYIKYPTFTALLLMSSAQVTAHTSVDEIINKSATAYGAEQLSSLQKVQFYDELYQYEQAQTGIASEGSHGIQLSQFTQQLSIDFKLQAKVFKRAETRLIGNHGNENMVVLERRFHDSKGYLVDHCQARYREVDGLKWHNVDFGLASSIDTLVIKRLINNKSQLSLKNSVYIQGVKHEVIELTQNGTNNMLYINTQTGLLTRLIKTRGERSIHYDFLAHKKAKGISWASEVLVSHDSKPASHIVNRQLKSHFDQSVFAGITAGYEKFQQEAYLDFPTPAVNELVKGVYLVGQGWGFSLFVDNGDHYISVGAWQMPNDTFGWQQRLALLQKTTGSNKPVKGFVVTHHHDDHLMGLNEVVKQGAALYVLPEHEPAVRASISEPLADTQLKLISHASKLGDGKIRLLDVPSSHAAHNLVVYLPEHQILFAEDMFGSSFAKGFDLPNSWPMRDVYARTSKLNQTIQQANINVQTYVSSHHGRVFSQQDFNDMLQLRCPSNNELQNRLFSK
ncbi:MAG: MBL fold metallo-hydrolase [Pseudomonadota bacterium]